MCEQSYRTLGPPGTCPKCWHDNALTDSDRHLARSLQEREEDLADLEAVVDLSTRFLNKCGLPDGRVRFTKSESRIKVRMVLGDGRKLVAEVGREQEPSAVADAMRGLARVWTAEGIGRDAAKQLSDMLRVPVVVPQ